MTFAADKVLRNAWFVLVAVTIASWAIGRSSSIAGTSFIVSTSVLIIAAVKAYLVMKYFMEARYAPAWLKYTCYGWLATSFTTIYAIYSFGV